MRYADTNGFELDLERPHAWRYRDYVVRSFNTDKPYDRFIREQIAGDEMFPGDNEALVATGYLRAGSEHLVAGNIDPEESRQEVLTEIATNVGQTFLGMTVNCARCHNHKFDPILQADFYALQAVFAGAKGKDVEIAAAAEKAAWEAAQKGVQRAAEARSKTALKALAKPYEDRISEEHKRKLDPKLLEALEYAQGQATPEQKRLASDAEAQIKPTWDEVVATMPPDVQAERTKLRTAHKSKRRRPIRCRTRTPTSTPASRRRRATYCAWAIRTAARPGRARGPVRASRPATRSPPESPGRRTAFANWLASRENPLTARVMANRIWQFRMGDGLVRTPNDFGTMGDKPESHELLDWLAAEFMERGWSIKAIDRLIVTSSAYRQSSAPDAAKSKIDPQNRLFWRMNRKRLEGEMIRDAALTVRAR